ncbi:MAG: aminotransferase class I/II-fold pyridoxal phosphate-dependent enzyme [Rhodopseudomonas palustris]|nr:aminotransferase class I/II-fold pyridoxal phosphate-dependent enzyme [Rhodopseudomonas palustris]
MVLSPPTFSLFDTVARISHGSVVPVDQNADFSVDGPKVLAAAENARLTFLCSPDNPTGHTVPLDFLERVCDRTSGLVAWDEAYGEFWGETAVPLIDRYPNSVILKTFSKALGLAGLRVGYLIGHLSIVAELKKVNIPFNVNLMSHLTTLKLLDRPEWIVAQVDRILSERNRLFEAPRHPVGHGLSQRREFHPDPTPDGDGRVQRTAGRGHTRARPAEPHPLAEELPARHRRRTPDENEALPRGCCIVW